jgi:hypothetical protein
VGEMLDPLDPDAVHDRESFLAFARALAVDRRASVAIEADAPRSPYGPQPGGWENFTIEDFLNAAVRWAEDHCKSGGQHFPAGATWGAFASFL